MGKRDTTGSSGKRTNLILLLVALGLLVIFLPMLVWIFCGWPMAGMVGMMGYGWGLAPLILIMFVALIAIGAYLVIISLTESSSSALSDISRALEALKERYARGEITRQQYLEMKKEIEA